MTSYHERKLRRTLTALRILGMATGMYVIAMFLLGFVQTLLQVL